MLVSAIWGSTFIVIKAGLGSVGPLGYIALRFGLAALLLAVFALPSLRRAARKELAAAATLGIVLFTGYALQTVGLTLATASEGGFITGLSTVIVPFVVWIWFRLRPSGLFFAGAAVATAGLGVLTLTESLRPALGDVLLFGCAVAFALHILLLGWFAARYGAGVLIAGQVIVVAVLALVAAAVVEGPPVPDGPAGWLSAIYTAVAATAGVLALQTWAQRRVSANRTAMIFAAEPVFAALFAALFGGERFTTRDLIGAALILAGIVAAVSQTAGRDQSNTAKPPAPEA